MICSYKYLFLCLLLLARNQKSDGKKRLGLFSSEFSHYKLAGISEEILFNFI